MDVWSHSIRCRRRSTARAGVRALTEDVDEVIAVLGPKEELDFEDFCLALARVGLAHGAGKVSGEPDPPRALVVISSSDGFAQAQRTPSRKSVRDLSPPSPMAALQCETPGPDLGKRRRMEARATA